MHLWRYEAARRERCIIYNILLPFSIQLWIIHRMNKVTGGIGLSHARNKGMTKERRQIRLNCQDWEIESKLAIVERLIYT